MAWHPVPTVGDRRNERGYVMVYHPAHPIANRSKWVREHRMVWYDAYGALDASTDVHHKNGVKTDNRLENLEALPHNEHAAITNLRHTPTKIRLLCSKCGVDFWQSAKSANRRAKRGVRKVYCSRKCSIYGGKRGPRGPYKVA